MKNTELIAKIKAAKTAEEIVELEKAQGVEITLEKAREILDAVSKSDELSDEALENIAGGVVNVAAPRKWQGVL